MPSDLSVALKEWKLLCDALLAGEQAVLLRKGGILEAAGEFELEHAAFLLYPTFIHQRPDDVKPAFRGRLEPRDAEPATVRLAGWCRVHAIFEVPGRAAMNQLDDLHVWAAPLLDMRFGYRPERPLYLVVVQAFRLPEVVELPHTLEYAGCRSWVPLERAIPTAGSTPALATASLDALAARIRATFAGRAV